MLSIIADAVFNVTTIFVAGGLLLAYVALTCSTEPPEHLRDPYIEY